MALILTPLIHAEDGDFKPFPFEKIGAMDLNMKRSAIVGTEAGGDILTNFSRAVLVRLGAPPSIAGPYSFTFDGRPASKYSIIGKANLMALYEALRDPDNYGGVDELLGDPHPDGQTRTRHQPIALEVTDTVTFVRVYFNQDFTTCRFVSNTGESGHEWMLSKSLSSLIRKLVKDADGKWLGAGPLPNKDTTESEASGTPTPKSGATGKHR